jgi:hypothetical protein
MTTFLGLILPLLILIIPIGLLIFVSRLKKIESAEFGMTILGCFILGLIVPIVSTFVSANGLAYGHTGDEPICVTGASVFFMLGYMINLIGVPIAGIALFPRKPTIKSL